MKKAFTLAALGLLAGVMALPEPAQAFRGGGFGGFRGGGFSGGGGHFGNMHYGDIHGPNGTTYMAGRPGEGASAVHVNDNGTWHAGGVNANGGTWHSDGYHGNSYYAGGWHSPTVVNNYVGGGCAGCWGGGGWGGAVAGAAVGTAVGVAAGAAIASAARPYPVGQVIVTPPASGCGYQGYAGVNYYVCGPTWFRPYYGANGLYYKVVAPPY